MTVKYFYILKPIIPRRLQFCLRRLIIATKFKRYSNIWPIDPNASRRPSWFTGWPEKKKFALIVTHDVEMEDGFRDGMWKLLAIDKEFSIRSSVGLVPKRYHIDTPTLDRLRDEDVEVYIHDLYHDGKLFSNYSLFHERAPIINTYIRQWKVEGFRAGAMHHNMDWIGELEIMYDMSTFDTDPFEPMPDAAGTIFPFVVQSALTGRRYIEIPYTLPQDLTTLILHPDHSVNIWIEKLKWVVEHNGMVSINIHPDYMAFGKKSSYCTYPAAEYKKFLRYLHDHFGDTFWNPLPSELAKFVRTNSPEFR